MPEPVLLPPPHQNLSDYRHQYKNTGNYNLLFNITTLTELFT